MHKQLEDTSHTDRRERVTVMVTQGIQDTHAITALTYHITFKVLHEHKGFIPFFEGETADCRTTQLDVSSREGETFSTIQCSANDAIFPKLGIYIAKDYINRFVVDCVSIVHNNDTHIVHST